MQEEEDRYGTKQFVQGKKEALTERIEQIRKEIDEPEIEHEHDKLHRFLIDNYRLALGTHTDEEDGRVGVFTTLLKEYTLAVIKGCMEVFADAQVREFDELIKGRQGEDDCNS